MSDLRCLIGAILSIGGVPHSQQPAVPNLTITTCSNPVLYTPGLFFQPIKPLDDPSFWADDDPTSVFENALARIFSYLLHEAPCTLIWASESYRRCSPLFVGNYPQLAIIARKLKVENAISTTWRDLIVRYASLSLFCHQIFDVYRTEEEANTYQGLSSIFTPAAAVYKYLTSDVNYAFLNLVFTEAKSQSEEGEAVLHDLYNDLCITIETGLRSLSAPAKNAITYLATQAPGGPAFVATHPIFTATMLLRTPPYSGVLGVLLHESVMLETQGVFEPSIKTGNGAAILQTFKAKQEQAAEPAKAFSNFILPLARTDKRNCIIDWYNNWLSQIDRATEGANLNLVWGSLELVAPIKLSKVYDLDVYAMLLGKDSPLIGGLSEQPRFADKDDLQKLIVENNFEEKIVKLESMKWPSQILWLGIRTINAGLMPVLKNYINMVRRIEAYQDFMRMMSSGTSELASLNTLFEMRVNRGYNALLCYRVILQHPRFATLMGKYIKLVLTWFGCLILENEGVTVEKFEDISPLLHAIDHGIVSLPKVLLTFPQNVLEDLGEMTAFMLRHSPHNVGVNPRQRSRDVFQVTLVDPADHLDFELLAAFSCLVLRSPKAFRAPHLRELFTWNILLLRFPDVGLKEGLRKHLVPALVQAYIDAQQSGYSGRINQRLALTDVFARLLPHKEHLSALKRCPLFDKFAAMMVEFVTWMLEESTTQLMEIKSREEGHSNRGGNNNSAVDDDSFDPSVIEQGENVSEMRTEQLTQICQTLCEGTLKALKVLHSVTIGCGKAFVESPLLLPQTVTSLNCCLNHLVGPKCLQIKVNHFERYNFQPRPLLSTLCGIYITLMGAKEGGELLLKAICTEGRYFSTGIFMKALKIVKRESLLSASDLEAFSAVVDKVKETAEEVQQQDDWLEEIWDEIPDDFKDPMMEELMVDPVLLPSSNHILDRRHIERHLMTESFDPFNRAPLTKEQLVPQPELKAKIDEFIASKRAERARR